jgi:hypothetical protein
MDELSHQNFCVNQKTDEDGLEHISGPLMRVLDQLARNYEPRPEKTESDGGQDDGSHTEQLNFRWVANG